MDSPDVLSGVINIVTGKHEELVPILAKHRGIHCIDFSGNPNLAKKVEELSVSNLKRVYVNSFQNYSQLTTHDSRLSLKKYLEFKTVWITSGF